MTHMYRDFDDHRRAVELRMTDAATAGYVAVDSDTANPVIYGIGATEAEALAQAHEYDQDGLNYVTLRATQALLGCVDDRGGSGVRWVRGRRAAWTEAEEALADE